MNRHHPYDPRTAKRGAHDFGQGSYKLLPTAINTPPERMKEIGYTLFQDFEHETNLPTRWFFKDVKTWSARIERIEQMGYKATSELQVT